MSAPRDDFPTAPASPSRREVLLSAAGALALGLGAPVSALAAATGGRAADAKITFHRGENSRPFHAVELPEEAARILADPRSRVFIKVEWSREAIPALDGSSKVETQAEVDQSTPKLADKSSPKLADKSTPKLAEEIKITYALDRVR